MKSSSSPIYDYVNMCVREEDNNVEKSRERKKTFFFSHFFLLFHCSTQRLLTNFSFYSILWQFCVVCAYLISSLCEMKKKIFFLPFRAFFFFSFSLSQSHSRKSFLFYLFWLCKNTKIPKFVSCQIYLRFQATLSLRNFSKETFIRGFYCWERNL